MTSEPSSYWVFGYGSILSNTGFAFETSQLARLPGYSRKFWQASVDHRGDETYPGRVVTLVPDPGQDCWGMLYQIKAENWIDVVAYLDHREKGGYQRTQVTATTTEGVSVSALAYIADEKNPGFVGFESPATSAEIIRRAVGPSGTNKTYILELHQTLTQLDIFDPHVQQLCQLVLKESANENHQKS